VSYIKAFGAFVFALVVVLLRAMFDGLCAFVVFAAIAGFFSWLGGGASPRDAALSWGSAIGAIWAVVRFFLLGAIILQEVRDEYQQLKLRALEDAE